MTTNSNTQQPTGTQVVTWQIDPSHSNIKWHARHMVVSKVTGQFDKFQATLRTEGIDFKNAEVEFEADVNSINTGDANRDAHLKGDDFFNAEQYPKLHFKSTGVRKTDDERYELEGDLTIRDVTKPVTLEVEFGGIIKDPYGFHRAGFNIKGKVDRFDYNLKWNALLETGGAVVSKTIVIDCDVEMITKAE